MRFGLSARRGLPAQISKTEHPNGRQTIAASPAADIARNMSLAKLAGA